MKVINLYYYYTSDFFVILLAINIICMNKNENGKYLNDCETYDLIYSINAIIIYHCAHLKVSLKLLVWFGNTHTNLTMLFY